MLSSTARPKKSGPVSVPSSKMIVIDLITFAGRMGGNATASSAAVQRSRTHDALTGSATSAGGELHPTKWFTPSSVTTLKRGAPAPQCDPARLRGESPFRMSYPSSVSVIPFTPFKSAPAEAKFSTLGPVLTSRSPSCFLSLGPPVGQAASLTGVDAPKKSTAVAPNGPPVPRSQKGLTRLEWFGSNSNGTTVIGSSSGSSGWTSEVAASKTSRSIPSSALATQSGGASAGVPMSSAWGPTAECGAAECGATGADRSHEAASHAIAGKIRTAAVLRSVCIVLLLRRELHVGMRQTHERCQGEVSVAALQRYTSSDEARWLGGLLSKRSVQT